MNVCTPPFTAPPSRPSPAPLEKCPSAQAGPKIVIVDDEPINIKITRKYLQSAGYQDFATCSDAELATRLVLREAPDLILLDIVMPKVNGLQILKELRGNPQTATTPILILTASSEPEIKVRALDLGATDFLAKPVEPSELLPRVRNALVVKAHQDHLTRYAERLELEVRSRTEELAISRSEIIECLARAAEYRDQDTGHHIVRVGKYAAELATAIGLPKNEIDLLEQAAQLHDVGKIGIPDAILRKPGRLDPDEFNFMKRHCAFGQKILQRMSEQEFLDMQRAPSRQLTVLRSRSSRLVELAACIALSHHEWWNGQGYPNGIAGESIPLEGRITAIADVYDALSSARPYKTAYGHAACVAKIKAGSGTQFDPSLVEAFLGIHDRFNEIRVRFADQPDCDPSCGHPT